MALNPTPGQAAALGLFASLYSKDPNAIKQLLEKHEQKFTWDPNIDLQQIAQLYTDRPDFFRKDFNSTFTNARYFSLKDTLGNIADAVKNAASTIVPILASTAGAVAPSLIGSLTGGEGGEGGGGASGGEGGGGGGLSPSATAALLTGGASALGQLVGSLFSKPKPPANASAAPTAAQMPQLPAQIASAVASTFAQNSSDISGQSVLDAIKNAIAPPAPPASDKILGMTKKTFYIVLASVVAVIVAVIVILIVRSRKKKKVAAK